MRIQHDFDDMDIYDDQAQDIIVVAQGHKIFH
jgi:hypothetical protein